MSPTASLAEHWTLDPDVTYLNHGSFGACPREVLAVQQELRTRLEAQPMQFFVRDYEGLLDEAREAVAAFVGAPPEDLVFVPNATAGVNSVLRSRPFERGDELLLTNQAYNACRTALEFVADRWGARVVVADLPFPIEDASQVLDAVMGAVTARTKLALLDHITSPTALVMPVAELVDALKERGVDTLVDGAHGPGMVPLDLSALDPAYYTANCHKWICAPKGAAFLYVRRDLQPGVRPLSISHGANSPRTDRSRYLLEFDWTGTHDPTAVLSVPAALRFLGGVLPGGAAAVMERNRDMVLQGRAVVAAALGADLPCPARMIGSLAAFPLPDGTSMAPTTHMMTDPLQDALWRDHGIEVPVFPWPAPPKRVIRVSAQLYNVVSDYEELARAFEELGVAG